MPSMRAVSSPQPAFTPLHHVTVNGNDVNNPKPTRRICGIKAKIVIAAVLLLLLLVILTAAIVMIAVAAAEKDSKEDDSAGSPDEEATSSTITVPVSERVSCPLKSPAACVKAGCLYSGVDLHNQPVSSKVPKCFYPKDSYRLNSASNLGNSNDYVIDSDDTSNQIEVSAILDDSESDSLTLTINRNGSSRRKRQAPSLANYQVSYHPSFGFSVTRDDETIFNLEQRTSLNIMKNFISVSLTVPSSSKAFGLGNFQQLEKAFDGSVYTMWTRSDEEGAHPFILLLSDNGTASGIFIDSSYPMDITLQRDYKINVVILNTQVKIRLFTGPTMADVIRQYWSVIGSPSRPPYWGLGHFYGSESVSSQTELEALMANHTKLGELPAEGILLSDAMNRASLPFSYSQETRDYIRDIHEKKNTRFIVTVPSSISSSTGEESYFMDTAGVDQKVFISRPDDEAGAEGQPLEGLYDKMMVKYPDFTSSNAQSWWYHNISVYSTGYGFHMHKNMPYSEINGSVGVCPDIDPDINIAIELLNLRNLEENTLCLSGTSKKGLQLELHNKFAWQQARVTQSALKPWSVSKSALVISDASNPGIGQYAGHFHDSNEDSAPGLKAALNEMVTFNFLGVTLVGPNICTKEFTTQESCLKWYYLSVVTPLAWSMSSGVAHLFAGDSSFLESVSTVLQFRQALLPYHYDAMYKAHTSSEVPLRFLAFDYPGDKKAGLYQDQVLLGDAILYTPVIRTGEEYRVSYLPAGYWCNWVDGSCYKGPTEVKVLATNSPASFTFLRGGTAVVAQNSASTTRDSMGEKVRLIVVLDEEGRANSTRFFDDGETANTIQTKYYTLINFSVANNTLTVTIPQKGYKGGVMRAQYERILVYGLPRKVTSITRPDKDQTIRGSSLIAGNTDFYKLIVSDTNVEIELSQEFQLKWDLQLNDGSG